MIIRDLPFKNSVAFRLVAMPSNNQATVYIGNLDERVDERLLYEIMVQAGPVLNVHIPRDKETKRHKGYAFAEYGSVESAQYALSLFSGLVTLYSRPVHFGFAYGGKIPQAPEVANIEDIVVGGEKSPPLNPETEKLFYRLPSLNEQRSRLMEDSGQITPPGVGDVKSYRPPSCSHTRSIEHNRLTTAGLPLMTGLMVQWRLGDMLLQAVLQTHLQAVACFACVLSRSAIKQHVFCASGDYAFNGRKLSTGLCAYVPDPRKTFVGSLFARS
ncbi:hypothetical protein R1flu_019959 [Riccia fluitans]|uniref:RRM domain-containing protein n=1 Tax=Riccia fluitans TaxID=41844 RepID=A0ABD1ZMB6_9MARC